MYNPIERRALKYGESVEIPPTKLGERLQEVYKLQINEDGTKDLVVVDHVDVYDMIQSHKDSVDIHQIVKRCAMTGNYDEMYKTEGFYGDLVGMPKSRAEALQMIEDAKNIWKKLPVDVKEKFDNDVDKFFATAFTKEWTEKLEIVQEQPIKESEVKDNE